MTGLKSMHVSKMDQWPKVSNKMDNMWCMLAAGWWRQERLGEAEVCVTVSRHAVHPGAYTGSRGTDHFRQGGTELWAKCPAVQGEYDNLGTHFNITVTSLERHSISNLYELEKTLKFWQWNGMDKLSHILHVVWLLVHAGTEVSLC